MAQHNLTGGDVARILKCSEQTVRIWRSRSDGRVIPDVSLRLLEAELKMGKHK